MAKNCKVCKNELLYEDVLEWDNLCVRCWLVATDELDEEGQP